MKNYTGSDLGNDFREFFKREKKRIVEALKSKGCTDIQMSRQLISQVAVIITGK